MRAITVLFHHLISVQDNNAFDKKVMKGDYKVGDKVVHKTYGEGIIQSISGEGINKMVSVNFDKIGIKNLLLEYAPLTKI
jgi:hypothetical protein